MSLEQIIDLILKSAGGIAIVWVVAGFLGKLVSKYFADSALEGRKAELQKEVEKHKTELGQETEKLKAELSKDSETHKWKLKKQEILFEKEFEAASEFFKLHRKLQPKFRHPDMEHDDAMEDVVDAFSDSEGKLDSFIALHGPVLSDKNRKSLDACRQIASIHQFAPGGGSDMREANIEAEKFLNRLEKVEALFVEELRR